MRLDLRARPDQRATILGTLGCAIVWEEVPELSATYAIDDKTMDQIGSVARDAASGLGLPFAAPTIGYQTMAGGGDVRQFTVDQVQLLYQTLRDYVAGLNYYRDGAMPDPPAQPVIITAGGPPND